MKNNKEHPFADSMFMIKFIFKSAPFLFIVNVLSSLAANLPWTVASVVLLRQVIDIFISGENLNRIIYIAVGFAITVTAGALLNIVFSDIILPIQQEKLNYRLYSAIYGKAARMDLASYDDPKFYNDFVLSMKIMDNRIDETRRLLVDLVTKIVSIFTIIGVIISIDPICLLTVLLCIAIIIPIGKKAAKVSVDRAKAMTPYDRKNFYYWRVFYLADYAKELRLNPVGKMIHRRYDKNIQDRLDTISPFLKKQSWLGYFQECLPVTFAVYFTVTVYMGYKAIVLKNVTPGDFTAAFNGAASLSSIVFYLTSWFALDMRENGLYIGKFRKFMAAPETIKSGEKTDILNKPAVIKLENVSFTYPGNDKPTLKNINLEIKPYEKVAFVGYNGAGKTTITNLLLHLYNVTEGQITLDGVNINEWNIDSYHDNFTAVFQDYSLFGATLGENVALGDNPDRDKAVSALKESGFKADAEKQIDTLLLKEFDENGIQFSGGEAQKIAIARAFYKDCSFAILDEPSANLDPEAEYELNNAMIRAAKDKTVIFISHRLSTTVMADKIFMFEDGEITESGTHEELMALNGKYKYMFSLQAEKYNSIDKTGAS